MLMGPTLYFVGATGRDVVAQFVGLVIALFTIY